MKKIISVLLVVSLVLTISSCGSTKIGVPTTTGNSPAELTDEELVKLILNSITYEQDYKKTSQYVPLLLDRDAGKMKDLFFELAPAYSKGLEGSNEELATLMYDTALWVYVLTLLDNFESADLEVDLKSVADEFERCKPNFINKEKMYKYVSMYTVNFKNPERLRKEVINFLYYYSLHDTLEQEKILSDLAFVCWDLNMSNEQDFFSAICFTKQLNTEITKKESGDGKIAVDDISELTNMSKKIWTEENASYDTLVEIYGTNPEIVYHEDNVTYLYTSDNYTSVCYGEPIYATVIFDHSNNELVYYKSKTIRGVIVDSENPESQSTNQSVDGSEPIS